VIHKHRGNYDRAYLDTETDGNDATYFLLDQLAVLRTAIDDLQRYLQRKVRETRALEDRLHTRDDLNHRQLALISDSLRHPDLRITVVARARRRRAGHRTQDPQGDDVLAGRGSGAAARRAW
jgi:Fic family protein